LAELALLSPAERWQLVAEWNASGLTLGPAAGGEGERLEGRFWSLASRRPEAVALSGSWGAMSYGELAGWSNRLSRYLRRLGVGPEVRVGVSLRRTPELVWSLLGVLRSGGAYVALDPGYPPERLSRLMADSGLSVLLVRGGEGGEVPPGVRVVDLEREMPAIRAEERSEAEAVELGGQSLAYVIYTSGSTGIPKGVGISHGNALGLLSWAAESYSAAELSGVAATTSIGFDLSVFELFVPLSCGGRVVLFDDALSLLAGGGEEVSLLNTVPSLAAELWRSGALPAGLLALNLAGEALPGRLVRELSSSRPGLRVHNLYGPSEDTTYSTGGVVSASEATPSIGRPLPGRRAYVLDASGGPVPQGGLAELWVGGVGLARGYLGRPDWTAERFVPDGLGGGRGERLYRTGDLVRQLRDGRLEFVGRRDHQVKVRGFRIELGEVESALQSHPAVREAVVLAAGEGAQRRLVAYVVGAVEGAALRAHAARLLPGPMVPSQLIGLPALPRTAHGKVDRRALSRLAPAGDDRLAVAPVGPRTPTEELLVGIWEDVLERSGVGVEDSFFDLGGHSLLAVR
ncbi:MAG TPA: non-ribosomal peptide synthetase, partial [Thermoanaerobaculia bacterium]|nr:non-ribosomal peptide synthetase [Thermoanaerobaculia bacterium]